MERTTDAEKGECQYRSADALPCLLNEPPDRPPSVCRFSDGPIAPRTSVRHCTRCDQAAVMTEVGEMRKGLNSYLTDHWNNIDVLGLTLMGAGFATRAFYHDSPWGRGLYSLSAPLVFARVLFFAQILRFQGPMIQVCAPTQHRGISTAGRLFFDV